MLLVFSASLAGCHGGTHKAGPTTTPTLIPPNEVHQGTAAAGKNVPPPQPIGPSGLPALLAGGQAEAAYLQAMAARLDVSRQPAPANVALFGRIVSTTSTTLVIANQPVTASSPNGNLLSVTSFAGGANALIQVVVTSKTDMHLVPGGIASLRRGTEVFAGGEIQGNVLTARIVADPRVMFSPHDRAVHGASSPATAAASPESTSDYGSAVLAAASTTLPPRVSGPGVVLADTVTQPIAPPISPDGTDTVVLSGAAGLPGFDPHFDAALGDPSGNGCSANVHAEFLVAAGAEFHWPFQFAYSGSGFTVASLDHSPKGFNLGPL